MNFIVKERFRLEGRIKGRIFVLLIILFLILVCREALIFN